MTLAQALDINFFGRDYSNLNNLIPFIPKILIFNTYTRFIERIGTTPDATERRSLLALPRIFFI